MRSNIKGLQVIENGDVLFDSDAKTENGDMETQLWLGAGVNLKSRVIEITGEVNEAMSSFVLRTIIKLNSISNDPIYIYLSTYGGSVYDGCSIYDVLRTSPSPIIIIANGKVASMGVVIFLAGTERYAYPNTRFMIHSVSHETGGTLKDTLIDVNEAKNVNDKMFDIISERSKLSRKSLAQNTSHDVWFDVKQAEKWGLITTKKKRKVTKK